MEWRLRDRQRFGLKCSERTVLKGQQSAFSLRRLILRRLAPPKAPGGQRLFVSRVFNSHLVHGDADKADWTLFWTRRLPALDRTDGADCYNPARDPKSKSFRNAELLFGNANYDLIWLSIPPAATCTLRQ
jgi:hypothetical protein